MALEVRYIINTSKIVYDTLDGEVIIINFDTGNYYSLNKTGKEIWNILETHSGLSSIADEIINRYSGEREIIKNNLTELLKDLQQEELIIAIEEEVNESPRESGESNQGPEKPPFEKPGFHKYTDMKEMLLLDPIHEVDETGWPSSKTPGKKNQKNT